MRKSVFLIIVIVFASYTAVAQEQIKPSDPPDPTVTERIRVLESELERQHAKLDQLQKTIADQQLAIQALLDKLSPPSVKAVESPKTVATEPQAPTVEQRVAKVEGEVKKIGPIRLSGDFRLRFDTIARSATTAPDPPLDHVQNVRMRYRFRLNFDANLHENLAFHAQLATGPVYNPLSTN